MPCLYPKHNLKLNVSAHPAYLLFLYSWTQRIFQLLLHKSYYLPIPSQENLSFVIPTIPRFIWSQKAYHLLQTSLFNPFLISDPNHPGFRCFLPSGWLSASNSILYNATPLPFLKLDPFVHFVSKSPKHLKSPWHSPSLSLYPTHNPHIYTNHILFLLQHSALALSPLSTSMFHKCEDYKKFPIYCRSILLKIHTN